MTKLITLLALALAAQATLLPESDASSSLSEASSLPDDTGSLIEEPPAVLGGSHSADWGVDLRLYAWLAGIEGDVVEGDFEVPVDIGIGDVFDRFNGGGLVELELRKNRWGILFTAYRMSAGTRNLTPGPFLSFVDTDVDMTVIELAAAYRVLGDRASSLDVLTGLRYLGTDVHVTVTPDFDAVGPISRRIRDEAVGALQGAITGRIRDLRTRISEELEGSGSDLPEKARDRLLELRIEPLGEVSAGLAAQAGGKIAGGADVLRAEQRIAEEIQNAIAEAARDRIADDLAEILASADEAKAIGQRIDEAIEERLEALKGHVSEAIRKRLQRAIREGMERAADEDVDAWLPLADLFVGLRARLTLSERWVLFCWADIGGFGIISDVNWQVHTGVRYRVSSHVWLEGGTAEWPLSSSTAA